MNKISNAQIAEVMSDAAATLRAQQAAISDLSEKLAFRDRRDRVTKLAGEMHRKGLELDTDVGALADRLEKAAEAGRLETVEQAVELVGPDMSAKLGFASHNPTNHDGEGGPSSSELERFIIGATG